MMEEFFTGVADNLALHGKKAADWEVYLRSDVFDFVCNEWDKKLRYQHPSSFQRGDGLLFQTHVGQLDVKRTADDIPSPYYVGTKRSKLKTGAPLLTVILSEYDAYVQRTNSDPRSRLTIAIDDRDYLLADHVKSALGSHATVVTRKLRQLHFALDSREFEPHELKRFFEDPSILKLPSLLTDEEVTQTRSEVNTLIADIAKKATW